MRATATRMLLLGAVATLEPVNGYQIRRELVSARLDQWAHVNPGSIYHGLTSLAGHGLVRRTDLVDGSRDVAVYELTPEGRAELDRLLVQALEDVDPYDRAAFQVALGMLTLVPRPQLLRSLAVRQAGLEQQVAELGGEPDARAAQATPDAGRARALWRDLAVAELAWLRGVVEDLRSGALRADRDADQRWGLPDADRGHRASAERDRYRELLGRTP